MITKIRTTAGSLYTFDAWATKEEFLDLYKKIMKSSPEERLSMFSTTGADGETFCLDVTKIEAVWFYPKGEK